ncbi:putative uncharacterized oxidoreductase [Lachnellula subtilissima]|uniref:Uncharacterized oxidoreductase n=1 Tax=Lachnellula subtilissima TaxID=602034 RepID=A0A8H8RY51_9HELO|nr:putative uncharacterized oxidoreductase [Lachnellula subtilissima]
MSSITYRVLLTGASGFIGNHILAELLSAGFSVRVVVRSQAKADTILQTHSNAGRKLDFCVVADITAHNAFSCAFESQEPFDTVIHTASPFLYRDVTRNEDLLEPAVKGTMSILYGARDHHTVKRVIILSSIAAIMDYSEAAPNDGRMWTAKDWNPVTRDEAIRAANYSTVYRASKTFSEKCGYWLIGLAWEFMEEQKPHFDLVSLNPPMVYGPLLHSIWDISQLNESNLRIWNLFLDSSKDSEMPPNGVYWYIDVRDLALAHIRAVTKPEIGNRRIIIAAGSVTSQEIADILRSAITALAESTPIGNPGEDTFPTYGYSVDTDTARNLLGLAFRSKEETFLQLARQLLEIAKRT